MRNVIDSNGAVRQHITVGVRPDRAFELFTARMTDWWPSQHHIGSAPISEIIVEPREGGRWYTRHEDGTETSTGYVRTWQPPNRLVLTWQISAEWSFDTALITTVDLTFTATDDGRTLVELVHGGFDNYGPDADRMRRTFDSPDAWPTTLAAYADRAEISV
jgi:uncharacterized protein YndB with AHSA1/START domain